jgi:hypothetical protein
MISINYSLVLRVAMADNMFGTNLTSDSTGEKLLELTTKNQPPAELARLISLAQSGSLEASSFSGSVTTDFPVEVVGKLSGKTIQGKVGKGGAEVSAKAFSGNVEIRKGS